MVRAAADGQREIVGVIEHFQAAVDFTTLGLRPEIVELDAFEAFGRQWGPFALRWYSLAYIGGIILGWAYLRRMLREPGAPMTGTQADDFITWATLGIIGGGRLGYVLFYNLDQYLAQPLSIFALWDGGMSFHGGAIGTLVATMIFARVNRLNWLRVFDYVVTVVPIGMFLGRCANFVNGELYGRTTGSDWGVIFPAGGPLPRYPSQLFEAVLEGLVLLAILSWLFWRTDARLRPGLLVGVFMFGMGVFRIVVEFYREADTQLVGFAARTGLQMGQWLSLPMVLIGALLIWLALRRSPQPA